MRIEIILRLAKMFAQFIQRKKQAEGDQLNPPDADKIRSLAALMEEVGLTELMYGIGDGYIRLKRQENTVGNTTEHSTSQRITIFSPCVGIIKATSDSGEPFVRLNDQVIEGQILAQ